MTVYVVGTVLCFFFFQAEDGIRDYKVTGVQTCALPISAVRGAGCDAAQPGGPDRSAGACCIRWTPRRCPSSRSRDRKSTRLNSSHLVISYAVFCLKKKKQTHAASRASICRRSLCPELVC